VLCPTPAKMGGVQAVISGIDALEACGRVQAPGLTRNSALSRRVTSNEFPGQDNVHRPGGGVDQ
jgi:hypothetical protein